MADDALRQEAEAAHASLAEKYRGFLDGLTGAEFALYRASLEQSEAEDEVSGLAFPMVLSTASLIRNVTMDVTVNKAKTADKAFKVMDAYIRG